MPKRIQTRIQKNGSRRVTNSQPAARRTVRARNNQPAVSPARVRSKQRPVQQSARRTKASKPTPSLARKSLSVVIPAFGRAPLIGTLVHRLYTWPAVKEVIVVANHCASETLKRLTRSKARLISYPERLGHDTGRAIGAMAATGKYVMFLDADINWTLAELRPFLRCLTSGADIALNRYPTRNNPRYHHPTAVAKRALNLALDRPDLQAASMTAVPHAIRRTVIEAIGPQHLATPPVFCTLAIIGGYRVVAASLSQVGLRNPQPSRRPFSYNLKDVILGDHAEAFFHLISHLGERGYFADAMRNREALPFIRNDDGSRDNVESAGQSHSDSGSSDIHLPASRQKPAGPLVAVIPAQNEAKTIAQVIRHINRAGVHKVRVVENGSSDGTARYATHLGADVLHFTHALGHDVPRAIGALSQTGEQVSPALFMDADFPVTAQHLRPFVNAVTRRGVDIALNNLSQGMRLMAQTDPVSTMKRFLNLMVGRPDLKISSPTAVPHALSARAIQSLAPVDLAVPPRLTVQAVLQGLNIAAVHYVDVVKPNRRRPINHRPRHGRRPGMTLSVPLTRLIIGDHLEAMALWLTAKDPRGGYPQPRRMDLLAEALARYERDRGNGGAATP